MEWWFLNSLIQISYLFNTEVNESPREEKLMTHDYIAESLHDLGKLKLIMILLSFVIVGIVVVYMNVSIPQVRVVILYLLFYAIYIDHVCHLQSDTKNSSY